MSIVWRLSFKNPLLGLAKIGWKGCIIISSNINFWRSKTFLIWRFLVSLDSSQCPLSTHVICLYIITNCKLLYASEGDKKGAVFAKKSCHPGTSFQGFQWVAMNKCNCELDMEKSATTYGWDSYPVGKFSQKPINPNHKEPCRGIRQTKITTYSRTSLKQYCWDRGVVFESGKVIQWAILTLGPGAILNYGGYWIRQYCFRQVLLT